MDNPPALALLEALPKARPARGGGGTACCPAHEDRSPSLSWTIGDDGRVLLHCHAGCQPAAIVAALGLTLADLFVPKVNGAAGPATPSWPRIVETYDYTDEAGELLYQAVRHVPKDFRQRRPDGRGGWLWNLDRVRLVPYQLPALVAAPGAPVVVVEGEKDADRLAALGILATTGPMGAGKWRPEYAEPLRGRTVYVIADNDEPGRAHAADVVRSLAGEDVRLVRLPGLPDKGDVSDYLDAGHSADELRANLDAGPLRLQRVVDDLGAEPPPDVHLVEGLFRPGAFVLVGGFEGEGKSYAVRQLTTELAAGRSVFGSRAVRGPAASVWVDAENGRAEDDRRVRALLDELDVEPATIGERLWRLTAEAVDLDVLDGSWRSDLVAEADRVHAIEGLPVLLVLDSADSLSDVDPWGSTIKPFVQAVRGLRVRRDWLTVVLIAHLNKRPKDAVGRKAARGLGDVTGNLGRQADVVLVIESAGDDGSRIHLRVRKRMPRLDLVLGREPDGHLWRVVADADDPPVRKVSREAVRAAIAAEPGLLLAVYAKRLGVTERTMRDYADAEEAAGLIYSNRLDGPAAGARRGPRRLFPVEGPISAAAEPAEADGNEATSAASTASASAATNPDGSRGNTPVGGSAGASAGNGEARWDGPACPLELFKDHQSRQRRGSDGLWRCDACADALQAPLPM